jgi:hypothetical protein
MRLFRLGFDIAAFALPLWAPQLLYGYLAIHLFYPAALRWPMQLDAISAEYGNLRVW